MKPLQLIRWFVDDYLLISYTNADFILMQKARVMSVIAIAIIGVVIGLFPFYFYLDSPLKVVLPPVLAMVSCIIALMLIRRGLFSFAGHLIIVVIFIGMWITLFVDSDNIIMKLDTIAFVVGAFTLLSLVEYRSKKIILVYSAINIVLMLIFYHHIVVDFSLEEDIALEYLIDNFVVLAFVATICYQAVSINKNVLDKANESIKIAHAETSKNQELAQSLEIKVAQRTKDLVKNNQNLQTEIKERKSAEIKLREAQVELVNNAHKAGMAEIASDSLHNVGNILNSVKTSAHVIKDTLIGSPMASYSQACDLIRENQHDLLGFVSNDPKGIKILEYCLKLEEAFNKVFEDVDINIDRLNSKIETINDVILAQQRHAGAVFLTEKLDVIEVIEDSLKILKELDIYRNVKIKRNYGDNLPQIILQKSKLIHILINLFKNAVQAMQDDSIDKKEISIDVQTEDGFLMVSISDTGAGINSENLKKIFAHGYTTKENGSGFGLHSCANYVNEMGASIKAYSEGKNKGATFRIKFPL